MAVKYWSSRPRAADAASMGVGDPLDRIQHDHPHVQHIGETIW